MSPVSTAAVTIRRMLVRRPWIYWLFVAVAVLGAAGAMLERSDRVDAARDSWGRTRSVWVAVDDLAPGDPLRVERREVPVAIAEGDVADGIDSLVARQHISRGEIVYRSDVVAPSGPQAMTPTGWLVVPVVESPPSGAAIGDRARAVGDGIVFAGDVLVVGHHDDVTLIAVPAEIAPLLPAAADDGRLTLLLVP
jgi:hypothetical protein